MKHFFGCKCFLLLLLLGMIWVGQCSAAAISGRVTNTSGTGIAGVTATAYGVSTSSARTATSDASGYYTIGNLPADTYKIYFSAEAAGYVSAWHATTCSGIVLGSDTAYTLNKLLQVANAGGTGVIRGKVTDNLGNPLSSVSVFAYLGSPYSWNPAFVTTSLTGDYSLTVPAGDYAVTYNPSGYNAINNRQFLSEFYDNAHQLDRVQTISVSSGSVTTISPVLEEAGTIAGTVSDSSGNLLSSVEVDVYDLDGLLYGSTVTGSDGTYAISLPAQNYRVRFKLNLSVSTGSSVEYIRWYDAKTDQGSANPVPVIAAETTSTINLVMPLGSLSGTVVDKDGTPSSGMTVRLYNLSARQLGSATTTSSGQYLFQNLLPGSYKVVIEPSNPKLKQWYANKYSFADATAVVVIDKGQATAHFVVSPDAGKIGGVVKTQAGVAVANIFMYIYAADTAQSFGSVKTDSNGIYQTGYLPPGTYKLQASGTAGYLYQWYTGKLTSYQADQVALPANTVLTDVDFALQPAATLTGTVRDQAGNAVASARVMALDRQTGRSATVFANSSGFYTMYLSNGNYSITFSGPTSTTSAYMPSYFNNKSTLQQGDVVAVVAPNVINNIDGVLLPGGAITGTVRMSDGTLAAAGMQVAIYDAGGALVQVATIQSDGTYASASTLPTGSYRVKAGRLLSTGIVFPYTYSVTADPITVTAPQTTSGVNVTLHAGKITGSAKLLSGCPAELISASYGSVCAYNAETLQVTECTPIIDDRYSFDYLPVGTYKLLFDLGSPVPARWYGGAHSGTASTFVVASASETSVGEAIIADGETGAISVSIRDEAGSPVEGTFELYDEGGARISNQALASGRYKVRVSPWLNVGTLSVLGGSYLSLYKDLWYNTKPDMTTASAVSVLAGTTTELVATITRKSPSELNLYYITASATTGGMLNPVGVSMVRFGSSATYNIAPDTGYQIHRVLIDGNSVGAVTSYTFSGITANHTISVEFVRIGADTTPPTITSFSVPQIANTYSISVSSFAATDNVSVDGFCISLSNTADNCSWSSSVPDNFTFPDGTDNGNYTLYAFAKDTAGNISAAATATITISRPRLTVSLSGAGGGSVSGAPGEISCESGTCQEIYDSNTLVTVTATANAASSFGGWSGACSGTGGCTVVMSADKSLGALFNLIPRARIGATPYGTLTSAFLAVGAGQVIEVKALAFVENLLLDRGLNITLRGGYADDYSGQTGYSELDGTLTIGSGSLVVDRIVVK